jgi:DNA modification methylase
MIKLSKIKNNPNNPRIIKDDKFKKLVQSIKEFPEMIEKRPMVCVTDIDGLIYPLGGNMRLKALKELNYKDIPDNWIVMADDWTEEKRKEFVIKDNVGFGEWDWDDLANNWDVEKLEDWGLDIPDFAVKELEAEEDDYEIPDEIKTDIVLGDLFEIGEHRLLCGDSTDSDQVAKLMNGNKADMVFTDPPYGIKVVGKNGKVGADNLAKNGVYAEIIGDDTTETAKEFYHTCQSLGFENYIIWGGNYFTDFLEPKSCWIIWDKRGDMNSNNFADGEMAWTSFNSPVRIKKQIWSGMIKEGESGKRVHPTQKPINLCSELLQEYTNGNNIFDGFGGSGSTMIACQEIKKKCFMIEMSPDYCQVIIDRMLKLDPTLEIKRNGIKYEVAH